MSSIEFYSVVVLQEHQDLRMLSYNQTRIAVEEADPFRSIMIDGPDVTSDVLEDLAPQFAIAVGLGVRASDGLSMVTKSE